jgi:hypothetical protein
VGRTAPPPLCFLSCGVFVGVTCLEDMSGSFRGSRGEPIELVNHHDLEVKAEAAVQRPPPQASQVMYRRGGSSSLIDFSVTWPSSHQVWVNWLAGVRRVRVVVLGVSEWAEGSLCSIFCVRIYPSEPSWKASSD